jgi:RIO kinase 1
VTLEDTTVDKYEIYEELLDPLWADPSAWRRRRPKNKQMRRESREKIIAELTDDLDDVDLGFHTTYRPSRHEAGWLLTSLYSFYNEGLITDVLSLIKGGKEASVYLCRAHPAMGMELLAAKVYRPRMFRNLRNDKMYRQGREILVAGGAPAGRDSGYIERAIRHKTRFGQQAAHTSWLMHEFTAMDRLFKAGGAVPQPVASSENAILMSYHGDERVAAPTLNTVHTGPKEAEELFDEVLRNIDLMLQHDLIHGDLSAYNILYWKQEDFAAKITLIDFPQVVNLHTNENARFILGRDLQRTCEYFGQQGVRADPAAILEEFWGRYVAQIDPEDEAADRSRLLAVLELSGEAALEAMPA